jgi:multiple sugar transport system substrate-binding protein
MKHKSSDKKKYSAKTTTIAIVSVVSLTFLTSACGTSSSANQLSHGPTHFSWTAAKGQTINVLFDEHPYANAIIQQLPAFEKKTGITVHYQVVPESSYFTKLSLALAPRNGKVDVFMNGTYQMWSYATAGYLQDLSTLLTKKNWTSATYDVGDFIKPVLNADRWNLKVGSPAGTGPIWQLPMAWEEYPITYNKTAFRKAGITKIPTTLPELAADAKKLEGWNGPGSYGIAVRGSRSWATIHPDYMSLLTAYGGGDFKVSHGHLVSTVDSPAAIQMTRIWIKMVKQAGPPGWLSQTWYNNQTDLGNQKTAMMYDADIIGYWDDVKGADPAAGHLGWFLPPKGPTGKMNSNLWVWSLAMNKYSTHKLASWLFLQWATGKQHDLWGALHKGELVNPARNSVWNNPQFVKQMKATHPGYYSVFKELTPHTKLDFTPEPDFFTMATQWAAELQNIETGKIGVKAGLTQLAQRIDQEVRSVPVTGTGLKN